MTIGQSVKTVGVLHATTGMLIAPKHLVVRAPDAEGVIKGFVPGHGGDVWWVEHENGDIAAYSVGEMATI